MPVIGSFSRWGAATIRKPGLGTATGLALLILLGLGTWQLTRLQWKLALLKELARTEALVPIPVAEALKAKTSQAWRPVNLVPCHIDPSRVIFMHGIKAGDPGYHLLTYCDTGKGRAALIVDLGFSEQKSLSLTPMDVSLAGRLRTFDVPNAFTPPNDLKADDWYWRSPQDLAKRFATPVREDYFLSVDLLASGLQAEGLMQDAITGELPNHHLEYALTWYGLALVMLSFYGVILYRATKAN